MRNEYTRWVGEDRHAEAFLTLHSDRSRSIMRNLGGGEAHREERCLACHATPMVDPLIPSVASQLRDGVGCESCHGLAGGWLGPHTADGWKKDEIRNGMIDLSVLTRRAEICAGCHVGAPAGKGLPRREVNHDLIAAGHPRLDFEFSAFMASMPAHWDPTRKAPDNRADFPARCWDLGQAVSRIAALELLQDRALRAQAAPAGLKAAPWPEFAEYGCFSCHHDLRDDPWRQTRAAEGAPLGTPRWGTWLFALDPWEADQKTLGTDIHTLRLLMNDFRTEPEAVVKPAGATIKGLRAWLQAHQDDAYGPEPLARRIDALESPEAQAGVASWDHAAQRYLALVPWHQALEGLAPGRRPGWPERLGKLRNALAFPPGHDSPRGLDPSHPDVNQP